MTDDERRRMEHYRLSAQSHAVLARTADVKLPAHRIDETPPLERPAPKPAPTARQRAAAETARDREALRVRGWQHFIDRRVGAGLRRYDNQRQKLDDARREATGLVLGEMSKRFRDEIAELRTQVETLKTEVARLARAQHAERSPPPAATAPLSTLIS
jgi:hypothetical protein